MTLSDARSSRHTALTTKGATLVARPPPATGLPRLPGPPFRHAVPTTPADRTGALVGCFPVRAAFPESQAGRHPRLHFRGLLRLHSRYGLPDRSTARGGLCHEASARPVARPNRSSATKPYRQLLVWILPPLVNRAFGAHREMQARQSGPVTPDRRAVPAPAGSWPTGNGRRLLHRRVGEVAQRAGDACQHLVLPLEAMALGHI